MEPKQETPENPNYKDLPLIQSTQNNSVTYSRFEEIGEGWDGKEIVVRARIHNSRVKGNAAFLVLRQNMNTLQAVAFKSDQTPKPMLKFMGGVVNESIVDIYGKLTATQNEIKKCSIKNYELQIQKFFVVNRSHNQLPFQMEDALRKYNKNQTEEENNQEKLATVALKTRLDNRVMDLRTPTNQAIFRVQSAICSYYRQFLLDKDFVEIHTPKTLGGTSEGGSEVFRFDYFGKNGCLAQSPQLYKQMMIMADFEGVFEIGPVFRAENSHTHRHLCEFTGLDMEMQIKEHYFEILEVIGKLFTYIFKQLSEKKKKELAVINEQFEFEPFIYAEEPVIITFAEGVALLKEAGVEQSVNEDLDTVNERTLGKLVRQKYKTDFYILHRYPESARPFYTMLCADDPNFTCSYDVFMRGQEIISGAQRIHDPVVLAERAKAKGIPPATIQDYIDSFKFGAYPHGGFGAGMERIVMLYLDLLDVRQTSAFPRDPVRLAP